MENKTVVRSGIVCLNAKTIVVLGGLVESLYEEWQMNQKYSGVPRSSLRQLQEEGYSGPPPFEKLQVRAYQQNLAQQKRDSRKCYDTNLLYININVYNIHTHIYVCVCI